MRIVALMVLRSHLLAGLAVGACDEGEVTLAASLWPHLPEESLTIVDRGFLSYLLFHQIQAAGPHRHWLTRAKKNLHWRVRQRLGPGDVLVDLPLHRHLRRAHPELPETLTARAIRDHRRGFRPHTLLTSLLDPATYPPAEIVELYHERWELEVAFDEVKTHTLEREEALRSRAPEGVAAAPQSVSRWPARTWTPPRDLAIDMPSVSSRTAQPDGRAVSRAIDAVALRGRPVLRGGAPREAGQG